MQDFDGQRLRCRPEAMLLDARAHSAYERYDVQKAAVIGSTTGIVGELGPATGANAPTPDDGIGKDDHVNEGRSR